ncbi:MAG: hypothetical protein H0V76_00510, partial [Blastocatellia bacterium]|nr:hypothetical protein [Blastocatellia bacterium]
MRTAFDRVLKILFVVSLAASAAFSQSLVAGEYDSLRLAVDDDGILTGYFRETTGQDGKWASVRMVSAAKSYFHAAADVTSKQTAYVVKNNTVAVYG